MAKTRCISLLLMFIMLLAFTHSQALAGFYTGNDLVPFMQSHDKTNANSNLSDEDWANVSEYRGYVTGVHDATEFLYSTPDGVTVGQIMAVVTKYLKNHPEEWSEPAAVLVVKALTEAFPLKKSK